MNINNLIGGGYRRRLMMACGGTIGPIIPDGYPDPFKDDGYIWLHYEVSDTSSPTTLLNANLGNYAASFIIDGVTVPQTLSYTFSTAGEHLVKVKRISGTDITAETFSGLSALRRVYLPGGITAIRGYGTSSGAFRNSTGLTHVYLSDKVTTIESSAFAGCRALKKINLDGVPLLATLGQYVFQNCDLSESILGAPSLTSIGAGAFRDTALSKVQDMGLVTSLPSASSNGVFTNCTGLDEIVFPSTLKTLGSYCFDHCSGLPEELELAYVTSFGERCLAYSSVQKLILGSVVSLANNALRYMNAVIIDLPATLTTMNQYGIRDCAALTTLVVRATTPPSMNGYYGLNGCSRLATIYVPYSADHSVLNAYKTASNWSRFASKFAELDENGEIPTT